MALFGRRPDITKWLQRGDVRLLLPADPGPEQMLESVRLFDPNAQPISRGNINVDGLREVNLSRGYEITPDVAAETGMPPEMRVAFFVGATTRAQPFNWSEVQSKSKEQTDTAFRLVNGLAARLGGIAHPQAPVLKEPLEARVYLREPVSPETVFDAVARYAPGLAEYRDRTLESKSVSAWETPDGGFRAELWPQHKVGLMQREWPRMIIGWKKRLGELTAIRLQLCTPANQTDPATARLLGECALSLTGLAPGACANQLGFQVTRPEEFVFPQAPG